MLEYRSIRYVLAVPVCVALAAALGGCGGALPAPAGIAPGANRLHGPAAGRPRMDSSACGKSVVYVTSYNNSVYIYDQAHNGKTPCGQITGVTNPQGLFVDKHHNLWVAISGDCKTQFSSVLEFAPGSLDPGQDAARFGRLGRRRRGRQCLRHGLRYELLQLHARLHQRK